MAKRDDEGRVNKGEFMALLALLGQRNRAAYRALRDLGWSEARSTKSESPN